MSQFFQRNRDRIPTSWGAWRHRIWDLCLQVPSAYSNYKIQNETLLALSKGFYITEDGKKIILNQENGLGLQLVTKCEAPSDGPATWTKYQGTHKTELSVINEDCLIVTLSLLDEGYNPVTLNMANPYHPGGSYRRGASAQEEDLFRRTDLSDLLDPSCMKQKKVLHPINDAQVISCPKVQVFRHGATGGYKFLSQVKIVAVLCCAAVRDPITEMRDGNPCLNAKDVLYTQRAIYNQLKVAHENGHDVFVGGAFGCGGFANPPREIAALYLNIIRTLFPGCFKRVVFSIVSSYRQGSRADDNYHIFKQIIEESVNTEIIPKENEENTTKEK